MKNVTIRVISDVKELESLAQIWNCLLQKCPDENSVYLTHEWVLTWWKHFGSDNKLNVLLLEKAGRVIAIIPLMKVQYLAVFFRFYVLETIGCANINYVGFFLSESRPEATATFLDYLERELKDTTTILKLKLVPEDSLLVKQLRMHAVQFWNDLVMQEGMRTLAPYIPAMTTWKEYFQSLSPKRRARLRQARLYLEKSHTMDVQRCRSASLGEYLQVFFRLHQRRWQSVGVRSLFSDLKMQEFYTDIADTFHKRKWLHFTRLLVDNRVTSVLFGVIYNQKFYAMTAARDTSYSKFSVGHLHYEHLIKVAFNRNLREFDFLRGDEPYKFYWTKVVRILADVLVIKKGCASGLRLRFLHVFFRYRGLLQYSPMEIYRIYLMRKREKRENRRIGFPYIW